MKTVTWKGAQRALSLAAFLCGVLASVLASRFWLGFLLLCLRRLYRLLAGLAFLCRGVRTLTRPPRKRFRTRAPARQANIGVDR